MRGPHSAGWAATILLGLEALGIAALAIPQVAGVVAGQTDSQVSAIALIVLTIIGAVAVAAFAVAVARGQSWGRSGGIVTQLMILAVALGAVTGAFAHPVIGVALAVPAVIVFALLVIEARRAGRSRASRGGRDAASGHADPSADSGETGS